MILTLALLISCVPNQVYAMAGEALAELLEQEETKLWHFSPLTLFNMYDEEKNTGCITFPEE
jgi:hypothetical protein